MLVRPQDLAVRKYVRQRRFSRYRSTPLGSRSTKFSINIQPVISDQLLRTGASFLMVRSSSRCGGYLSRIRKINSPSQQATGPCCCLMRSSCRHVVDNRLPGKRRARQLGSVLVHGRAIPASVVCQAQSRRCSGGMGSFGFPRMGCFRKSRRPRNHATRTVRI
jgi:hypothetical protein